MTDDREMTAELPDEPALQVTLPPEASDTNWPVTVSYFQAADGQHAEVVFSLLHEEFWRDSWTGRAVPDMCEDSLRDWACEYLTELVERSEHIQRLQAEQFVPDLRARFR